MPAEEFKVALATAGFQGIMGADGKYTDVNRVVVKSGCDFQFIVAPRNADICGFSINQDHRNAVDVVRSLDAPVGYMSLNNHVFNSTDWASKPRNPRIARLWSGQTTTFSALDMVIYVTDLPLSSTFLRGIRRRKTSLR